MNSSEKNLAVVIGGGNGIGEACCRLMVERGWKVAVADYDGSAANAVAESLGAPSYQVDVRDRAGIERLAADIENNVGPVQSLVVAAGAVQERTLLSDLSMEVFRNILTVNIEGTFVANRAFATSMVRRRKGSIVNLGSTTGHSSTPLPAYGPSKAAIVNMTRALAVEWGRSGVRVNSVSPGVTLVKRVLARKPGRYPANIDDLFALGRRIQPSEVAEGIEFLASDRASAITGTDLLIDAGMLAASGWAIYGGVPPAQGPIESADN